MCHFAAPRVRPLSFSWQHIGTLLNTPRAPQAPWPAWGTVLVWASTPAAPAGSNQPEPSFCRISKTPLHSQLAKPQHSSVTWDRVLLVKNMTFISTFPASALLAEPNQDSGQDRPSCDTSGPKFQGTQLADAALLCCHDLAKEQGTDLVRGCFLDPKPFCCVKAALLLLNCAEGSLWGAKPWCVLKSKAAGLCPVASQTEPVDVTWGATA